MTRSSEHIGPQSIEGDPSRRHPAGETRPARVRRCSEAPVDKGGEYVLYWMTSARRTRWNFALEKAIGHCRRLRLPLLVFEPLRADYRWACDRFHRFVIEGMVDNRAQLDACGVSYYPYVEPRAGAGKGLLEALARRAALVVTDDYPAFFLPRMLEAAAGRTRRRLEAVDSNGIVPMRAAGRTFATAHAFRRYLHGHLPTQFDHFPAPDPLAAIPRGGLGDASPGDPSDASPGGLPRAVDGHAARIPPAILSRWPRADLSRASSIIGNLPIDHTVGPVELRGGAIRARERLATFLDQGLERYAVDRNHPERDATSRLSPYLHFGHISAHEILAGIAEREAWTPARIVLAERGRRAGWWGMSEGAEAFLDQLVTWRELGFNRCAHVEDHDSYAALPEWARRTLGEHAADPREWSYEPEEFEEARTHDPLWNAAQNQLRREGRIHNYLRMLWGKKILEWSPSPRTALRAMIHLNDKYALDGRDPNSYTGILWVLGLHDRAWGPERPVFGKIRYMSSANTARKYRVRGYVARYADPAGA